MHQLVELQHLTRKEFLRGLEGVSCDDARRRLEPMNCISWIIGHMACQEHGYFVAWPQGRNRDPEYAAFGFGSAPSQPPLEEAMALWRATCEAADECLHAADEESLTRPVVAPDPAVERENLGTRIVRNIFHYWSHIGEISAIRQTLGHERPPQFVDMHDWKYGAKKRGSRAGPLRIHITHGLGSLPLAPLTHVAISSSRMVRFFRRKKEAEEAPESAPAGEAPADEALGRPGEQVEGPDAEPTRAAEPSEVAEAPKDVEHAVERTRRTWFSRIGGMFRRGLDDELWEELEETLIAADTGVETTVKVLDNLKERVQEEGIRDPEQAQAVLKEELLAIVDVDARRGWGSFGRRRRTPRRG
jgi:hypothetical protein